MIDRYGDFGFGKLPAEAHVPGKAGVFFMEKVVGELTLDVCGDCGHGDIRVSNYREIYEAFLNARKQQR
jgi:hypothetical protein